MTTVAPTERQRARAAIHRLAELPPGPERRRASHELRATLRALRGEELLATLAAANRARLSTAARNGADTPQPDSA